MNGPVFGKPPRKSNSPYTQNTSPFESTDEPTGAPNKRSSLRTSAATDAHLRIVSLQIGEREAVSTIKATCQECMDLYGVSAPLDDINDPLSGILIMGNMMKRIGQEKLFYAQTLDRRIREYDEAIRHKNDLVG